MRRRVPLFLLALLLAPRIPAGEETAPRTSRLAELIRASSPKFVQLPPAPPPPVPPPTSAENPAADPDVIEMPKFFVEDSKLARVEADKLLGKQALAAKMRREYRNSLTALDWALNSFNIPFLTPSVAARARAKYENDQRLVEQSRLNSLIEVTSQIDPQAAAELRFELKRR